MITARAPGRVNLLGEHTDYNDGYVLPTAIPQHTTVSIAPSGNAYHHFHSVQLDSTVVYRDGNAPPEGFALYIHGCIQLLRERGFTLPPLTIEVDSQVPMGAGLSSSAALEVAVLRALRSLYGLPLDDVALALLAQEAEVRFAHVRCGIMDQMASSLAQPDRMLFLDTRTLERRLVPLPAGTTFVVLDSGVPRSLAASGYNQRRSECERAAQLLGVRALRDVAELDAVEKLPAPLNRRARHVVTENQRVLDGVREGIDASAFGALDVLVDRLQRHPQVFDARLTGAGFGGACVALVEPQAAKRIKQDVLQEYGALGHRVRVLV